MAEAPKPDPAPTPIPAAPGSAKRPMIGMLVAFVVVVLIIALGARTLFHPQTHAAAVSTAGAQAVETTAPADHTGH